jgi:hypothetical protein
MRKLARTLARLPIRLRLALAFTGVLALVLLVAGIFLAREFERDLDRSIDAALRTQAQDIVALVETASRPTAVLASGNATSRSTPLTVGCWRPPGPPAG